MSDFEYEEENEWGEITAEESVMLADSDEADSAEIYAEAADNFAEDHSEILPLKFLATPAELAEDAALREELEAVAQPVASERRSRRRKKSADELNLSPEAAAKRAKTQRKAKFLLYGSIYLFFTISAIVVSYKLPLLMGYDLIWPWSEIFPKDKQEAEQFIQMPDGSKIAVMELRQKIHPAKLATEFSEPHIAAAEQDYNNGDPVKALVKIKEVLNRLTKPNYLEILERYKKLGRVKPTYDKVEFLSNSAGEKFAMWNRDLTEEQRAQYQQALKDANLVTDEITEEEPAGNTGSVEEAGEAAQESKATDLDSSDNINLDDL